MKSNIKRDRSRTSKKDRRCGRSLRLFFLCSFLTVFCLAAAPSAAEAWTVTLTNPGTGGGKVQWWTDSGVGPQFSIWIRRNRLRSMSQMGIGSFSPMWCHGVWVRFRLCQ